MRKGRARVRAPSKGVMTARSRESLVCDHAPLPVISAVFDTTQNFILHVWQKSVRFKTCAAKKRRLTMRACVHSAVHLRRSVVGRSRSATGPARTTLARRGERSRAYRVDLRVRPRGAREIAIGKRAGEKTDFFFRLPPWETTRTARAARWSRCSSRCAPTRGCSATTASCGAACRRRSPSAWGTTSSGAHPHPCGRTHRLVPADAVRRFRAIRRASRARADGGPPSVLPPDPSRSA